MWRRITMAGIVLASSAPAVPLCAQAQPSPPTIERLFALGAEFGTTREQLRVRFGPPTSVRVDTVSNEYTGHLDSLVQLNFDGLEFHVRTAGDKEFVQYAEARRPGLELLPGVVLGRTREHELRRILGEPASVDERGGTLRVAYAFAEDPGAEEHVILIVRDGILHAVAWSYYVD